MADEVKGTIYGADELVKNLKNVTTDMRYKGGRSALRKAAMVVVARAKENAQRFDDPGTGRSIADNVGLRWNGRLWKQQGNLGFRIGVLKGAVLPKKGQGKDLGTNAPTPHWRLLEFGTQHFAAVPWLRPALANNIAEVTAVFVTTYSKRLNSLIKKARQP